MSIELVRMAKEELAKRVLQKRYQENPILWLTERFGEPSEWIEWSLHGNYENHTWDGTIDPISSAWKSLAENKWTSVTSGTGTGKTFALARIVYWFLDCFPNSLVVTTTPKESQLKLHLWTEISKSFAKFKRIRPNAELQSLRLVVDASKDIDKLEENEGWQAVGFVAGVGANEESATKAQGFHREHMLIIMEETPGIGLPLLKAFENTSTGGHNLIFALGNPDSEVDTLGIFSEMKGVTKIRISALDHPNIVLKQEIYKGAVTLGSIERRKNTYGEESQFYRSRVRGFAPEQSKDSLIRLEWIHKCIDAEAIAKKGRSALGIDVANSEAGDMAALAWGKGNVLMELEEFQCPNATHLTYNLIYDSQKLASKGYDNYNTFKLSDFGVKANEIGVDGVGVGVATVNAFKDHKMKVISLQGGQLAKVIPKDNEGKPMFAFNSLRSQMYWQLREDIRLEEIVFAIKDKTMLQRLIQELVVPKVEMRDRIAVESKEHIKRRLGKSPNLADVVAYWNWMRRANYTSLNSLPFGI